jgi:hypothetical protein
MQRFELNGEDIEGVVLDLQRGVRVAVEVMSDGLKEGEGDPLWSQLKPEVTISFGPLDRVLFNEDLPRAAGPNGRLEFDNVFFEPLEFRMRGLPEGWVLRELIYNGQPMPEFISLNPAALSHTLTALVCPVSNSIFGTVKEGDRAAGQAKVAAVRFGTPDEMLRRNRFSRANADAQGNFTLAKLPPGQWRVVALPAGADWRQASSLLLMGAGDKVEIGKAGAVRVDLSLPR